MHIRHPIQQSWFDWRFSLKCYFHFRITGNQFRKMRIPKNWIKQMQTNRLIRRVFLIATNRHFWRGFYSFRFLFVSNFISESFKSKLCMVLELQTPPERRICQKVIPTNPFSGLVTNIAVYVFDSILCVYRVPVAHR